jgi:hypothetical protein
MEGTSLRIATWNMGSGSEAAWAWLPEFVAAQRLQFVLLQEARPPAELPSGWRVHAGTPDWRTEGRGFTTAVLCCDSSLHFIAREVHRLATPGPAVTDNAECHPGTAAVVEFHSERGNPVIIISAYGLIDGGSSHATLHRLLSDLEPFVRSANAQRVLLGGDLNSGDQPYDSNLLMHELLWRRIELLGFRNVVAEFATGRLAWCSCEKGPACRQYSNPEVSGGFHQTRGKPITYWRCRD